MTTVTIIIFGDPRDTDWRISRLRMESNAALTDALDKGKINILYILPNKLDNWKNEVSGYSSKWTVGCGDKLNEIYDMRATPSVYLIGSDGKILLKNTTLNMAVNKAFEQLK